MVLKVRERTTFNFRIRKDLKKQLKAKTKEMGLSTCFVLECLIRAWLMAPPQEKNAPLGATIVVNQKIDYLVKKSRRQISYSDNCYMNGMWTYRRVEKGEALSKHGHVSECECLACRPRRSKVTGKLLIASMT